VAAYIARPWWAQRKETAPELDTSPQPAQNSQGESLTQQREALLITLRDLDFDYNVGTVTEEDYGPLRQSLLTQVADIMAQQEQQAAVEANLEARIEAEILAARRSLNSAKRSQATSFSPPAVASLAPASNGTCPACGWTRRPDALYCVDCGIKLPSACPECGQTVHSADLFCNRCGTELALAVV
jgi:hypothetical protein